MKTVRSKDAELDLHRTQCLILGYLEVHWLYKCELMAKTKISSFNIFRWHIEALVAKGLAEKLIVPKSNPSLSKGHELYRLKRYE